jgi:HAD superfamily hydrolase (TIGR01450 family)
MNHQNPPIQILKDKELYVFDMDGTIYLGKIVFDFAIRFIENLRAAGKRVLFFTNNASRSTDVYLEKLTRLGFSPTAAEIMSSADVTVAYLNTYHKDQTVYLIGTKQLESQFRAGGICLATGKEDKVDVVVSSFDTELTYEKLDDGCRLIRNGATYLCTHPDFNCPTDTGFMPDSGAIAALTRDGLLKDAWDHPDFDNGGYPGTYGSSNARNKIDYLFLTSELYKKVRAGGVIRKGMWPGTSPKKWEVYDTVKKPIHAASDHAALWVDLDI